MTADIESNRGRSFVTGLLPWVVAGVMLVVYLLTLNHSITPSNIYRISELSGWYSRARFFGPLTFLLTYPFRWLPLSAIPMALNFFNAVCGALTLALLARSVALLPHNRTHDQRQREQSEFSFLTIPSAWLPPVFAVLVCGFQMTFWENAVNAGAATPDLRVFSIDATGEMLDVLMFAYVIRCLLEYRISMRESWLIRFALVYGLGMANNWAMIGFFPAFLAALVWIRGLSFFNPRFLGIITACGLAGLMLILFFPIKTGLTHIPGFGFWQALRYVLASSKSILSGFPRDVFILLALTSLLPVCVMGIRWASYFGDTSQIGIFLATAVFHIVHALILLACLWVAFDSPLSPREKGMGLPFLSFYYLGALGIGYYSGYFLLIFGTKIAKARHRPPPLLRVLNRTVTVFIWVLAIAVPALLIVKNYPQLRSAEAVNAAFGRCFAQMGQPLPARGAVVLSDDALRLDCFDAALNYAGKRSDHLLLNTRSLAEDPFYLRGLDKKYPEYKLAASLPGSGFVLNAMGQIMLMDKLVAAHNLYYLHPSFGSYFERFYMRPEGMIYRLKAFVGSEWKVPDATPAQLEDNEKFWDETVRTDLALLTNATAAPLLSAKPDLRRRLMNMAHLTWEPNETAVLLSGYYSRAVDFWGVELQRSGLLDKARVRFEQARQFNPDNVSAQINLDFNRDLRADKKAVIQEPKAIEDKFGKHRSWIQLLDDDGPFDDPSYCYELGVVFANGSNYRQAIQQFDRARTLAPGHLDSPLWLCKLFTFVGSYSEALTNASRALEIAPADPTALFYKGVSLIQLGSFAEAIPPLTRLLAIQTNNLAALMDRGIAYIQLKNYEAAKPDYEQLEKTAPKAYQVDFGLQEIAYHQKDTNALIKYLQLYLTNYYQSFPTNVVPPETDEVKSIKARLKESQTGAP